MRTVKWVTVVGTGEKFRLFTLVRHAWNGLVQAQVLMDGRRTYLPWMPADALKVEVEAA